MSPGAAAARRSGRSPRSMSWAIPWAGSSRWGSPSRIRSGCGGWRCSIPFMSGPRGPRGGGNPRQRHCAGLSFASTLDRWFDSHEQALRERVRAWLGKPISPPTPRPTASSRPRPRLLGPALRHSLPRALRHGRRPEFDTRHGGGDGQAAARRSAVVAGARHMMALTHWQETNALLSGCSPSASAASTTASSAPPSAAS